MSKERKMLEDLFSFNPEVIISNKLIEKYGRFIEILGAAKFIELSKKMGGEEIPDFLAIKKEIKKDMSKAYKKGKNGKFIRELIKNSSLKGYKNVF